MKLHKKGILASAVLVVSISISALSSYNIKAAADEETLSMVKAELQEQINEKTKELEEKDKKLEELNDKIVEQSSTIDQLNNSIKSLNEGLNNTNTALDNAKKTQKADKVEIVNHSDARDDNLQKQIDEQKENYNNTHKTNPPVEAPREDPVVKD